MRTILLLPAGLFLVLASCSTYQDTVQSRRISAGYNADGTIGFSDKVVYRTK